MRPSPVLATLVTSAATVLISVTAPPGVARADQTAQQTITQLKSEGYEVNVDRVGSAGIDDCLVTSVRNPHTETRYIRDYYGRRDANGNRRYRIIEVIVSKSISVSLNCAP